ncbi:MAG: tRNA (adenosine(37)-N6)-dimethylallyltransferase MiaA [Deltaproteobacteria bacterium]|jgi:tRNA dimethylallyltransferase|nr:tRNA (adenosine(37)-N6)-dimethylallyltransferase MiaA [Deltaproteobacteria bacterium]
MKDREKIVIITGPTATGKSALAVKIALELGGEIVNCDSMQVYKGMDIGTAKPAQKEMRGIPHHLIDIVNPDEEFNASLYREHAIPVIRGILSRGRVCFVVGGTGLYIKSLLGGLFECPRSDPHIRQRLLKEYDEQGREALYERLKKVDPESAKTIHPNDRVRITRAIEVFELTGMPFSAMVSGHLFDGSEFLPLKICLFHEREMLYERINMRSIRMFESGLIQETEALLDRGYSPDLKPLKSIGYRHAVEHLKGVRNYDDSVELLKQDTRRYAKRQLTWFRADPEMIWFSPDNADGIIKQIKDFI